MALGIDLMEKCASFGTCSEGTVKCTGGYLLPAKHILHVVPPREYYANTKDILRKIYQEILHTADSLKASSIAIPTIGTGMLSYPARECASLAMEEVKGFLESMEFTSIEKIGEDIAKYILVSSLIMPSIRCVHIA
jgi:O-acetyl-ADP-ribose deacetylase (regulator of RNase III)